MATKFKKFGDRIENNHLRMTILEKAFVNGLNGRKRVNDNSSDEYG
jgi:hypothetical protein